jgi:hypothetical protein
MSQKDHLHDTGSACAYLAGPDKPLQPNTLEIWRVQGRGPKYIKVGRLVRYRESDLDAWLEGRTRTSTSQHTQLASV